MPGLDKTFWRIARQIHAAFQHTDRDAAAFELPMAGWSDVQLQRSRLARAEACGWNYAVARQRERLVDEIDRLVVSLRDVRQLLVNEPARQRPTEALLYAEVIATAGEFGAVEADGNEVWVTTESIELEGLYLGPFEIRLDLRRLGESEPYRVVALEPNPAASCSETTHPHVHAERLCAGEGKAAIAAALAEGRLGDFFMIVDRILHTYAEGSAYVELDRWSGVPCHDCDCTLDEDDRSGCGHCENTLCSECLIYCCCCDNGFCAGCIGCCPLCEDSTCGDCLNSCRRCRRQVCDRCWTEDYCQDCAEERAAENEDEAAEAPATTTSVVQP